jgi:hypothetical protein
MAKKTVPVETIPEVAKFIEAAAKWDRIKAAYEEAINAINTIAEEYNTSLEAAEKAVKANGVSCGPFTILSTAESYDANMLIELMGNEAYLKIGGEVSTIRKYEINKDKVNAALVTGALAPKIADAARKTVVRFNRLHKVELP